MENMGLSREKLEEQINKPHGGNFLSFPTDKKSLLNMVIFLVVSFGVIGYLFYQNYRVETPISTAPVMPAIRKPTPSPVPDELVGWKTYKNQNLGFSFDYPSNWQEPETNLLSTKITVTLRDGKEVSDLIARLEISRGGYYSQSLQKELTLTEYINKQIFPQESLTSEKIALNNWEGRRFTHHVHGVGYYVTYVFLANTNDETDILSFVYRHSSNPEEYKSEMPQTLDQILSIFKFLDSEPKKCNPVTQPCNPQSCDYDPVKCEELKVEE